MRNRTVVLAIIGLAPALMAAGQVVQAYRYDANGRLIEVQRTESGVTAQVQYTHDDADNRVSVTRDDNTMAALQTAPSSDLPELREAAPVRLASAQPAPGKRGPVAPTTASTQGGR